MAATDSDDKNVSVASAWQRRFQAAKQRRQELNATASSNGPVAEGSDRLLDDPHLAAGTSRVLSQGPSATRTQPQGVLLTLKDVDLYDKNGHLRNDLDDIDVIESIEIAARQRQTQVATIKRMRDTEGSLLAMSAAADAEDDAAAEERRHRHRHSKEAVSGDAGHLQNGVVPVPSPAAHALVGVGMSTAAVVGERRAMLAKRRAVGEFRDDDCVSLSSVTVSQPVFRHRPASAAVEATPMAATTGAFSTSSDATAAWLDEPSATQAAATRRSRTGVHAEHEMLQQFVSSAAAENDETHNCAVAAVGADLPQRLTLDAVLRVAAARGDPGASSTKSTIAEFDDVLNAVSTAAVAPRTAAGLPSVPARPAVLDSNLNHVPPSLPSAAPTTLPFATTLPSAAPATVGDASSSGANGVRKPTAIGSIMGLAKALAAARR